MANLQELRDYKKIYMIGIGGVSMSGIAELLNHWGFSVSGSDVTRSDATDKLITNGIPVTIGHNPELIHDFDLVVYTSAISKDDVELNRAIALGIPTVERKDFLGAITRAFRNTICISGTHGKTTTTSMVSMCFLESGQDPTIQIGANLEAIDGNYRVGKSEYFILEACEYARSFLKFSPKAEIILNIDNDHLDYYENLDNIKAAFIDYVKLLPDDGILVYNYDDENCYHLSAHTKAKGITYGIKNSNANFVAKNISFDDNGYPSFDVYHNNSFYKTIKLSIPGKHNVLNALACIALCDEFGIDKNDIKNALKKYKGAERRFQLVGKLNGAKVYDDYGHHPTEIKAVYEAMKKKQYNHSWIVFQPHTYSRTKLLLNNFANILMNFDNIIVTDIYAAREKDNHEVTAKDIVDKIDTLGRKAYYISDFDDIAEFLTRNVKEDDIVITQGAGTITKLAHNLVQN